MSERNSLLQRPSLQDDEEDTLDLVSTEVAPPGRSRLVSTLVLVFYIAAAIISAPLLGQYVSFRKGEQYFNATNGSMSRSVPCQQDNSSTPEEKALKARVQRETTNFLLYTSLVSGIPAILANLVFGSYSDYFGRRKLFLAPLLGGLAKALVTVAVIQWHLDLNFLYLGNAVDGLTGSIGTVLLAAFAVSADVTLPSQERTVAIALVDFSINIGVAVCLLVTGYLIEAVGYTWPAVLMLGLLLLSIVILLFLLPETLRVKKKKNWSLTYHLRNVMGFFLFDGTTKRKVQCSLCIFVFFFSLIGFMGRSSLESIYQLNEPFCWDPHKIAYFGAASSVSRTVGSTLAVVLLQRCIREELVGALGVLLGAGSFVLEGLAVNDLQMYMVCLLGCVGLTVVPVTRSLLSRMSTPEKQGAMFSSIAAVESACNLGSSLLYNAVYSATIDSFHGTVFMVMAGTCVVAGIGILAFYFVTGKERIIYEENVPPPYIPPPYEENSRYPRETRNFY